jgi:hypothetical protein
MGKQKEEERKTTEGQSFFSSLSNEEDACQ